MSVKLKSKTDSSQPLVYQIRILGHLGQQWMDWFEGLTITLEDNGETLLTGAVVDQAALHGLLKKLRDFGLPLLSVNPVEPGLPTGSPFGDSVGQARQNRQTSNSIWIDTTWKGGLPLITFPAHFNPGNRVTTPIFLNQTHP